jgi:acetylornithine deacetylase/succinyl-diaminopimelate desuccinylase-like protein
MVSRILYCTVVFAFYASAQRAPDWSQARQELLKHFQALVRMDTSDPPGHEAPAVEYLRTVLEREGIGVRIVSVDAKRPNLVARLKGSGSRRPLLIMAHTDTVSVQPEKWKHPPFGAVQDGPHIYGRGAVDDKDNLATGLMVMLLLKRLQVPLERDVIFLAEAGEEGAVEYGIKFLVEKHWNEIEAEFCLAEGGGVVRAGGRYHRVAVGSAEKVPFGIKLVARGTAGHGSVPLLDNPVVQLSQAIAKVAAWRTPMRLNDITRTYFERLATVSSPEARARYNGLTDPQKSEAIQDYLQAHEPRHYSMLRTSISPNIVQGGYRTNVIPSTAEATLDVRLAPGDEGQAIMGKLQALVANPRIALERSSRSQRPANPPSRLDTEMFHALELRGKQHYPGAIVLPTMGTGATDMSFLRAKGVQCYGIGPAIDEEDGPKGFGAHSDQERILVEELYRFLQFHWDVVLDVASTFTRK